MSENNHDLTQADWGKSYSNFQKDAKKTISEEAVKKSTTYIEEAYDKKKGDSKSKKMEFVKNRFLRKTIESPRAKVARPTMEQELSGYAEIELKEFLASLDFYKLFDTTETSAMYMRTLVGKLSKMLKKYNKDTAAKTQMSIFDNPQETDPETN